MDLISALILAIVQGISEWLPVSSSGHLVLAEKLLNTSGGLLLEVALHFGTLMAVFVYFSKDIVGIAKDILYGNWKSSNARLGFLVIVASIPAGIIGFLIKGYFDSILANILLVGIGFAITSMMLFITSVHKGKGRDISKISPMTALIIGCAQALAIMPGVSRAGSTISSGILLGLDEKSAMRFSFLMAIPIILGATFFVLGDTNLSVSLLPATLVSFLVGLATIHFIFTKGLSKRKNFLWFGIYCLILSMVVIYFALN